VWFKDGNMRTFYSYTKHDLLGQGAQKLMALADKYVQMNVTNSMAIFNNITNEKIKQYGN